MDINNTIYATASDQNRVQVWLQANTVPTRTISSSLSWPSAVFVSISGDIYIDNGEINRRVDKWTANATNGIVAMYVNGTCFGLFLDISDNLYCSMDPGHQVAKKAVSNDASTSTIVAGTGVAGSTSNMLSNPRGIFVDVKFNLYVADCGNDRVQLFQSGQLNGTTVAGNGALDTITLSCPTSVVLDADSYLFIVDYSSHRVVGSGPNGFRCIAGCTGSNGSASNQLSHPSSLSLDSYGNIFVTDLDNDRIQKFLLANSSCGKFFNIVFTRTPVKR